MSVELKAYIQDLVPYLADALEPYLDDAITEASYTKGYAEAMKAQVAKVQTVNKLLIDERKELYRVINQLDAVQRETHAKLLETKRMLAMCMENNEELAQDNESMRRFIKGVKDRTGLLLTLYDNINSDKIILTPEQRTALDLLTNGWSSDRQ